MVDFFSMSVDHFSIFSWISCKLKSFLRETTGIRICQRRRKLTREDYFEQFSKSDCWVGRRGRSETVSHSNINEHKRRQSNGMSNQSQWPDFFFFFNSLENSPQFTCAKSKDLKVLPSRWSIKEESQRQQECNKKELVTVQFLRIFWQSGSG